VANFIICLAKAEAL